MELVTGCMSYNALQLNRAECDEIALSEVSENGLTMLGTMLGSSASQQSFLASKIDF